MNTNDQNVFPVTESSALKDAPPHVLQALSQNKYFYHFLPDLFLQREVVFGTLASSSHARLAVPVLALLRRPFTASSGVGEVDIEGVIRTRLLQQLHQHRGTATQQVRLRPSLRCS